MHTHGEARGEREGGDRGLREKRTTAGRRVVSESEKDARGTARETHLTDVAPHYYFADTDDSILVRCCCTTAARCYRDGPYFHAVRVICSRVSYETKTENNQNERTWNRSSTLLRTPGTTNKLGAVVDVPFSLSVFFALSFTVSFSSLQ